MTTVIFLTLEYPLTISCLFCNEDIPKLPTLEVQRGVLRDLHNSGRCRKDSFDLIYAGRRQREKALLYDSKIKFEMAFHLKTRQFSGCYFFSVVFSSLFL